MIRYDAKDYKNRHGPDRFSALSLPLNSKGLRPFPAGFAAGVAEGEPVVFPVARNAGEEGAVGGDAFGAAEDDAAVIDEADFAHWLFGIGDRRGAVVEQQEFAGQR